ncbi:LysR family transcriptional regulator [Cardiobacteriaceae bacterium TAE3-ERU3]|nr:LysR family transcriptional regulator [Cardiobacteriaceae bacterium TAE3-ERU3]
MSFSSDTIRVLQIIAQTGSFSEAAKVLHRVPSAVSYTVKKMEEELEVPLFDRSGKNVRPTPAAQYIIEHSDWILHGLNELKRNATQISTGIDRNFTIALNYIVNPKPIAPLLEQLISKFPATKFAVRTEVYNGCWDALYEGRADLVIGAPQSAPHNDGVSTEYLGDIRWSFVVAASHPLADHDGVLSAEDVRAYPSIVVHDSSVALSPKKTWALKGQKVVYAADLNMVLTLIQQGIGLGFLPDSFIESALADGSVVRKQIIECKQPVPVYYAWRLHHQSVLLDFLLDILRNPVCKQQWLQ